jgi:hypothetical protein
MQVLRAEPYLELSSGQSAHCYQLFVEKDPKIEIPTVQVLRNSTMQATCITVLVLLAGCMCHSRVPILKSSD